MTLTKTLFAPLAICGLMAGPAFAQDALQLSAPAERDGQTVTVNGTDIFYSESGAGDALVLLHGYPLSGALFERMRDTLDDAYRVITIDHRGYGNSTTPEPVTDVATYAEDALAVLDRIGVDRAAIGGMSMGGPIVFEMYRQDPDIFSRMLLIDTNHMAAGAIEAGIWEGAQKALQDAGEVSAIIPFLIPNMLTGAARTGDATPMPDYLTSVMKQASLDGALGGATVLANRPDSTETLKSVGAPVLVLVGLEDPVYPVAISQKMADLAPDGTLAIIDGASHAAVFERPDKSAEAILDFMSTSITAKK